MKSNPNKIPELLAPAGNLKSIRAAVAAGADAVYFGGKSFNARRNAVNMSESEMKKAVAWCKKNGIKVYVTLNILIRDSEWPDLIEDLNFLSTLDIDGLIVQDPGLIDFLQTYYPNFKLQTSTQGSVYGLYGTRFFEKLGFERVVLPREMAASEIRAIADQTDVELKIFCHGALCYAFSGQCLMSSMIGGRSGNRGLCAQPCRKTYKLLNNQDNVIREGFLLSLKDLNTLDRIDDVIESGANSLKIEGRMKTPEYVYAVTKAYREALDGVLPEDRKMDACTLNQVFNRDFTEGHLFGAQDIINPVMGKNRGVELGKIIEQSGKKLKVLLKPEHTLAVGDGIAFGDQGKSGLRIERLFNAKGKSIQSSRKGETVTVYFDHPPKTGTVVYKSYDRALMMRLAEAAAKEPQPALKPLDFKICIQQGKPVCIHISIGEKSISYESDLLPQVAEKSGLTEHMIQEQFSRLGDTPYKLQTLELALDEGLFLSKGQLNALRRDAVNAFERTGQASPAPLPVDLNAGFTQKSPVLNPKLSLQLQNLEPVESLLKTTVDKIVLPVANLADLSALRKAVRDLHQAGKEAWIQFPRIMKTAFSETVLSHLDDYLSLQADGIIVNSFEVLSLFKDQDISLEADQSMNLFNRFAAAAFLKWGFSGAVVSPELKGSEVRELSALMPIRSVMPVYGHQEIMISANCLINCQVKHCQHCHNTAWYQLEDSRGARFPMRRDNFGYTHIYNGAILYLQKELLSQKYLDEWRLYQTTEKDERLCEIIAAFNQLRQDPQAPVCFPELAGEHYTKGNYKRGVE